jgi:ketosteroid isomerase-like protein
MPGQLEWFRVARAAGLARRARICIVSASPKTERDVKRPAGSLLMLAAAACMQSSTPMADSPTAVMWDSAAETDAKGAVDRMVTAFATMDIEAVKSLLAQDGYAASYELDLENKPVRMSTRDDAVKYAEDVFAEVKKLNATMNVNVKSNECHATSSVAYCSLEHDFSAKMPDGQTMTQPTRASIVLVKEGGTWKWAHWHSSLSAAPPASAAK